MRYRFLENVAIADICFEAFGKTLEELFENSALAAESVQVELKSIKPEEKKEIKLSAKTSEELLHKFLEEIVYLKDAEQLLFSKFSVKIKGNRLVAQCIGQRISKQLKLNSDVKAVTWHLFGIKKGKQYTATVVLDI